MKFALVLAGLVAAALAAPSDDHYTDKYDNIDLDEILGNEKLLIAYIKCLLDEGKCTPEGKELKTHLQDALETDCSKCTENQRKGTEKVIRHLIKHQPEYWEQLKAKYDPNGVYSKKHEDDLKKIQSEK